MTTFNVSIPENKIPFFEEFLDMMGASYEKKEEGIFQLTDEQKKILLDQENISLDDCTDAEVFYNELKQKYEL